MTRTKRTLSWVGAGLGVVLTLAVALVRPDRALQVGAGLTAHNLCAATFTSGLAPEETFAELLKPMLQGFAPVVRYSVNRVDKSVTASAVGLVQARAVYTEGYGCRLIGDPRLASPAPVTPRLPLPADGFAPDMPVISSVPALQAALDQTFAERPNSPAKRVKAVVVVKSDRVVAERYAPGFGVQTPLLSYSVAKSFTNALLGVLVQKGKLAVSQPVQAKEWSGPSDPRSKLTLNDLLRMQSGLDAKETNTGFDAASRMLYSTDDMAAFAGGIELKRPPGTGYEYSSINTLLLDRVLGQTVGGGANGMRAFADRELFTPAHMDGVVMEFDAAGTFSGSAHVYAPARAYARLGVLFLHEGMTAAGERLLPADWVAYSRKATLGSDYAAGFWTNEGPTLHAAARVTAGFPKDGYFASGFRGQRIYIVPSQNLVVARFGYSDGPTYGIEDDLALIAAAIRAVP